MIEVTIDGKLHIKGLSPKARLAIQSAHQIKNPDYQRLIARNKQLRYAKNLSEFIRYWKYDQKNDVLSVGRGSLDRLRDYAPRSGLDLAIDDQRVRRSAVYPGGAIQLRDYQRGVPDDIVTRDHGIARADTGFGKTAIALEVARSLGQRTLVIVPKLDLAEQFAGDARRFLQIEPGIIQGDTFEIGEQLTIATAQTLYNRIKEGKVPKDLFGCVIVDECHLFVPEKRARVVEWFAARYRYGFTATARRSDGQGDALKFMFGETIVDKEMPRKAPTIETVKYEGRLFGIEYHEIIEEQTKDAARNELIGQIVLRQLVQGRKVLVLTKRVDHYETIAGWLERRGAVGVHALSSSDARDARKARMDALRGDPRSYSVLLGTFSLLSTGTDIPSLDTLVLAGDLKSDVLAEQSAGRVLRLFEGKPDPRIIDIVDTGSGILKNQARLRRKFYQEKGWQVMPYGN